MQSSPRQHVRTTIEETVNEHALGWFEGRNVHRSGGGGRVLAAQLYGLQPADLRNSVIEAFIGRNDARNEGNVALVFGNCSAMDGLTVRSITDFTAVRLVASSGRTEMCSSSTTRW